jgi:FAD/FMN-containing dehydrogenase
VSRCADEGRTVRVAGEGHSWTPVVETDDVVVSLEEMTGVVSHDPEERKATIRGGTTLEETTLTLHERGLAFPNLGDVTMQKVAGAIGTGTHGTGPEFENLSGSLVGGRLVTGTGEVREFDAESDPELRRRVLRSHQPASRRRGVRGDRRRRRGTGRRGRGRRGGAKRRRR